MLTNLSRVAVLAGAIRITNYSNFPSSKLYLGGEERGGGDCRACLFTPTHVHVVFVVRSECSCLGDISYSLSPLLLPINSPDRIFHSFGTAKTVDR